MAQRASRLLLLLLGALVFALAGTAAWLVLQLSEAPTAKAPAAASQVPPAPGSTPAVEPAAPRTEPSVAERTGVASAQPDAPVDALWIEGRVVFPPGTPLDEEVFVVADSRRVGVPDQRARVAPDGSFRAAFDPASVKGRLDLDAPHLYLVRRFDLVPREATAPVVLEPVLGGRIAGVVRPPPAAADDAQRLSGANVTWATTDQRHESAVRTATLDGELRFELRGLPAHREAMLQLDAELWPPARRTGLAVTPGEAITVELELREGVRVAGRLVAEGATELAGATVHAWSEEADGNQDGRSAAAEPDGTFQLRGLATGLVTLRASVPGHPDPQLELGELADGARVEGVELRVARGRALAGRVVRGDDGSAVAGAVVEAVVQGMPFSTSPAPGHPGVARSEGDGGFRISGLADAPLDLRAFAELPGADGLPTSWHARVQDVAADVQDLVLRLQPGAVVTGEVVDDLGAPVPRFSVSALGGEGPWWMRSHPGAEHRLGVDGRFRLAGLPEGQWVLHLAAKGYVPSRSTVVELPGDGAPVRVVLPRAPVVSGVVLDPDGRPCASASVQVEPASMHQRIWGEQPPPARCDAQGRFELQAAGTGAALVVARDERHAASEASVLELAPGQHVQGLLLRLRRPCTLTGEVALAVGEVENGQVRLIARAAPELASATLDPQRRFAFHGVAPGRYMLQAMRAESAAIIEPVELAEGETRHVVLGGPPARPIEVRGTVRRAGEPLEGARVQAWKKLEAATGGTTSTRSDGSGAYALVVDGPGDYQIWAYGESAALRLTRHVSIPDQPSFTVDFDFGGGRVSGRVVDPEGAPAERASVQLELEPGQAETRATTGLGYSYTDADGRFDFRDVLEGTYRLTASAAPPWVAPSASAALGSASLSDLRIGADTVLVGLELRLPRAGSVEGTVRGTSGALAPGAYVFARDEQGAIHFGPTVETDSAGRYRIGGLAPGAWSVLAVREDAISDASAPVRVRAGETAEQDLALREGARLRVVVEEQDGSEVGASLSVRDARGHEYGQGHVPWITARKPEPGAGRLLAPLPAGTYRVVATNHGGATASGEVTLVAGAERLLTLRHAGD